MATPTRNPQDNWTTFRHLLEQLLDTVESQTELLRSLLEEGNHADHLDFIAAMNDTHRFPSANHPTMRVVTNEGRHGSR